MSDTILQSNDVMDSRRGDIVVGVDGSDESFAALRWALGESIADRTAGECGLRMDPFMGYGIPAGR